MATASDTQRISAAMADIQRIAKVRAADSWDRLPEPARTALLRRRISQEMWGLLFGYQLGRYMTRAVVDATSADAALPDAWAVPDDMIDALAIDHVNRILRADDSVLEAAPVMQVFQNVESSGPAPREHLATPFDGLVYRLWGSIEENGITIGPLRLVGVLEGIVGYFFGLLAWIPATLAETYRLIHGERTIRTLAKAAVLWLGVVVAVAWLLSPK